MAETEEKPDPNAPLLKRLLLWRLIAILCVVLAVAMLGGGVATVWYAAKRSMSAFNDLPKYRVNTLAIEYRETVERLDASMANTQAQIYGEAGQAVLLDAKSLAEQVLAAEQQFHDDIGRYGEAVAEEVEAIGGALEWNQHYQMELATIKVVSEQRQIVIQALINKFPVLQPAKDPKTDPDADPDTETDPSPVTDPKISPVSEEPADSEGKVPEEKGGAGSGA